MPTKMSSPQALPRPGQEEGAQAAPSSATPSRLDYAQELLRRTRPEWMSAHQSECFITGRHAAAAGNSSVANATMLTIVTEGGLDETISLDGS
jgi:hypothetical protein